MRFRPSRRALVIAGVVLGTLIVLAVLAILVVYPRVGRWMIEERVVPRLEERLDRRVAIGAIDVGRGHAVLRDVRIGGPADAGEPLVRIDRIDVDFDFRASLRGRAVLGAVVIDGVAVRAHRAADGADNFRDVIDRLTGGDAGEAGGGGGGGRLRPTRIEVRRGDLRLVDALDDVTVTIEQFTAGWARGERAVLRARDTRAATGFGPAASATGLTVVVDPVQGRIVEIEGGVAQLWPGMSLTGIAGSLAPGAAGRFELRLAGGYGGVDRRLWTASGWIDPAREQAAFDLDAERFTLDRLRPILERSPVLAYEQASVDARLHVEVSGAAASFDGAFHLRDFTVNHPYLSEKPIEDLAIGGEAAGRFDRASRTLIVDRSALTARDLPFEITGWLALPGGTREDGQRRSRAALDLRFVVPKRPCQEVLAAIPPELVPYMQGFVLRGNFDTDLRVAVDWTDVQGTVLTGRVGIWGCKGRSAPAEVTRLAEPFEHFVEVERDQWLTFHVGPDNPDFVPIDEVSRHLLNSLMTTEDSSFYGHRGFITREFRTALIKNLEAGYFRYGASSITMQMVKNVLLYREKTASRKFQELFLTWYVETILDKNRIFEIYVNVIEYGPGIYGIGPAAQHYFGKHPRELSPVEAAFFSSILPNPKERYAQYCKGTLRRWTADKISRILALMYKRGRLTEEEYQTAVVTPLLFARDETESEHRCMERRKRAMKNARSTNPLKK
jgi:hypothetical protein